MEKSPKEYDIEENIGNFTRTVIEDKIYSFDFTIDSQEAVKMLTDSESEHNFSESLKEFITECGFKKSNSENEAKVLEMKRYICNKFSEIGEADKVSEKTVGRWLKGESRPDYSPKSRETMFILMFALGADLIQTYKFFLKVCYAQPFNFKNQSECVYYWCLKNDKGWETVKRLKNKIAEAQSEADYFNSFDDKTILIGKAIDELLTEEELIAYISSNISADETYFNTARNLFKELLDEAKSIAGVKYDEIKSETDDIDSLAYRCRRDSVDFLLSVIFDSKTKIKPQKIWNPRIKENFPTKEQISRCCKGDISNVDILRKCMLLLMFFIVYGTGNNQDFDEFYSNVNYQLEQCGFPLLYPVNPYDRIFLTCVFYGTSNEYFKPLDCFASIFNNEE